MVGIFNASELAYDGLTQQVVKDLVAHGKCKASTSATATTAPFTIFTCLCFFLLIMTLLCTLWCLLLFVLLTEAKEVVEWRGRSRARIAHLWLE
mmetsp:Transcript_21152/g.47439  ORF Transcript_21152/g.47439 Transcript_21152/m.47439 type:complete len:94 (-) Transcript_21152:92-373(-)